MGWAASVLTFTPVLNDFSSCVLSSTVTEQWVQGDPVGVPDRYSTGGVVSLVPAKIAGGNVVSVWSVSVPLMLHVPDSQQ